MAKKPKLGSVEIQIPLHEDDHPYARSLKRVDASRCLAIGNRYARWLHGDEPGALLDLGGYFGSSTPHVLPDGRVLMTNDAGLVILEHDRVEARSFAFEAPRNVYRSSLSAGGVLLTGVSDPFAVWVDLEGRQTHLVEAPGGAVVQGDGVAFALRTEAGALRVTRHEGAAAGAGEVPWEATETGLFVFREVAVSGAVAHRRRLFVTHSALATVAVFDDAGMRRIETSSRVHLARAGDGFVALRNAGGPPTVTVLDDEGTKRWEAPVAPYTDLYAVGAYVVSMDRKGAKAALFDAKTGAEGFRGDLALSRADEMSNGTITAVPGGVMVVADRHRDPQKCAWLLAPGSEPLKVPHEGVKGAIAWGDDAFATWSSIGREPTLSLRVWTR